MLLFHHVCTGVYLKMIFFFLKLFNLHRTVFDTLSNQCSFVQSGELTAGGPEKLKKKKKEDEAVAAASVGLFRLPETKMHFE